MFCIIILAIIKFSFSLDCSKYYDYSGEELRNKLKSDIFDNIHIQLGYTKARQYLYGYIDNVDESLNMIYSGLNISCPSDIMSTNCNGTTSILNCEHIVPQSFFDENEPMKSDLVHLTEEYNSVNSSRSNNPFGECDPDKVYKWYKDDIITTKTPETSEQGEYSKYCKNPTLWEPRDSKKGYVSRAVLYFYTMYPDYINDIDKIGDLELLISWNDEFEPDDFEISRNEKLSKYQGNNNPYVECPDLINYAFVDLL